MSLKKQTYVSLFVALKVMKFIFRGPRMSKHNFIANFNSYTICIYILFYILFMYLSHSSNIMPQKDAISYPCLCYYRFQSQCHSREEFWYVQVWIRGLTFINLFWFYFGIGVQLLKYIVFLSCFFVRQSLCQQRRAVSHLGFQLFEPCIHAWPELCHLLLQSNQLPLPRAHARA